MLEDPHIKKNRLFLTKFIFLTMKFIKMKKYLLLLFAFASFAIVSCEDDDHDDHEGHDHSAIVEGSSANLA